MKKTVLNSLYWGITAIVLFSLQSCSEDEKYDITGDTNNKVYINTHAWSPIDMPDNSFLFNVTNTPVGSTVTNADSISVKFPIQCTQIASNDVMVQLVVDNSLVNEGYSELPENVKLITKNSELTILKGAMVSEDSVLVSLPSDQLKLLAPNSSYMVPVKINSVQGAQSSSNLRTVYLIIKTVYSNCVNQAESVPGSAIDSDGWTATVNGYDLGNDLFDDNPWSYYWGENNFTIEIDFGTVHKNITGLETSCYSFYYAIGTANIYTSSTNTDEYVLQGNPAFISSANQYVEFYGAVDARYIKLEITSSLMNYGIALTEFNAYMKTLN